MNQTTAIQKNFKEAEQFLKSHARFLLTTHARTDGDDCGSMLAITATLLLMDKTAVPIANGGVPSSLRFLPYQNEILDYVPEGDFDAIIMFGCNDPKRPEFPELLTKNLPILNIDHHPDNQLYGQANLVDPAKSSVAEMIFDFLKYLGTPITPEIAKCLLTGIFTDTGSFIHSNTSASTLNAAAELMKRGARVDKIFSNTYSSKALSSMKAWAKAIENTRTDAETGLTVCALTEEDLAPLQPLDADAFDGFVETINSIPGTRFALFIRQDGEYIKGSLRSEEGRGVDVSKVAKLIAGGGGHRLASGFKTKGRLIKDSEGAWHIE